MKTSEELREKAETQAGIIEDKFEEIANWMKSYLENFEYIKANNLENKLNHIDSIMRRLNKIHDAITMAGIRYFTYETAIKIAKQGEM